jgi:hypothetical protein
MATADNTNLKQILRVEYLPALGGQSKYYDTEAVKVWLNRRNLKLSEVLTGIIN